MGMTKRLGREAKRRAHLRRRRGMTLVEIMIVVIIMAMIATAVGMAVIPQLVTARIRQAQTDAATIRSAVEVFQAETPGTCPSVEELIERRILNARTQTDDPWSHPYVIDCESADVSVSSLGPDGNAGTEDDIR
jgi:general secretion pathway protein G